MSATIVITSWNNGERLRIATRFALAQTWKDTQVIIADDNSSDPKVHEFLASLEDAPNLVIFNSNVSEEDRPKTARYATQINTAVQLFATGKYLLFLPDDDVFFSNKVERHVTEMFKNDWDVSYSSQSVRDIYSRNEVGERRAIDVLDNAYNIVDHGQVCVTRAAFDAVGGWPDGPEYWSGADAYFWNRLTDAGYKFHPINETLCIKMQRDGVQSKIFSGRNPWQ